MATSSTVLDSLTSRTEQEPGAGWAGAMRLAAGVSLVTGTAFWAAGMFFSPPQESMADADYIASLARDLTQTQVSALFLHYANLLLGLGVLAAPSLVRGSRGLRLTVVGALFTALSFVNISGLILADWWNAATGTLLEPEQAAAVFDHVKNASLFGLWSGTEMFSLVGSVLLLAGLARAGVLGWWTIALLVGGVAGLIALGASQPVVVAAVVLVGFSPYALIGVRLLQRHAVRSQ